jgi:hypothetical protein
MSEAKPEQQGANSLEEQNLAYEHDEENTEENQREQEYQWEQYKLLEPRIRDVSKMLAES